MCYRRAAHRRVCSCEVVELSNSDIFRPVERDRARERKREKERERERERETKQREGQNGRE